MFNIWIFVFIRIFLNINVDRRPTKKTYYYGYYYGYNLNKYNGFSRGIDYLGKWSLEKDH